MKTHLINIVSLKMILDILGKQNPIVALLSAQIEGVAVGLACSKNSED